MVKEAGVAPVPKAVRPPYVVLRTFASWGVLFGMFVAIYFQASGNPSGLGVLALLGVVATLLLITVVVGSMVRARGLRRAQVDLSVGGAALAAGQLERANEQFSRCCESSNPVITAVARHNLGWTLMRQGRLREAIDVVADNDATHQRDLESLAMYATSADLALYCALLGKLDEAESWLKAVDERAAKQHNASLPAMRAFSQAVLDCRRDRCEDAARSLDEEWGKCEAVLTGADLRPLRVVRAFAHAARGPRASGIADDCLASMRPAYEGELDFLGVAWPEMQAFLVSHGLARGTREIGAGGDREG